MNVTGLTIALTATVVALPVMAQVEPADRGDIVAAEERIGTIIAGLASQRLIIKDCGENMTLLTTDILTEGIASTPENPILGEIHYSVGFNPGASADPELCAATIKSLLRTEQFNGQYLNPIGASSLSDPTRYDFRILVPAPKPSASEVPVLNNTSPDTPEPVFNPSTR